jgi:hypothetical protein
MTKNGRTILQISPHQTFLRNSEALYEPRLVHFAAPCLRASRGTTILVASVDRVARVMRTDEAALPSQRLSDTQLASVTLTPLLVERLGRDHLVHSLAGPPGKYLTLIEAYRATQARTGFGTY